MITGAAVYTSADDTQPLQLRGWPLQDGQMQTGSRAGGGARYAMYYAAGRWPTAPYMAGEVSHPFGALNRKGTPEPGPPRIVWRGIDRHAARAPRRTRHLRRPPGMDERHRHGACDGGDPRRPPFLPGSEALSEAVGAGRCLNRAGLSRAAPRASGSPSSAPGCS